MSGRVLAAGLMLVGMAVGPAGAVGPAASILRHEIYAELDVPAARIAVTDVVSLHRPPARAPLRFLLNENLEIVRIDQDADGPPLSWSARDRWDPRHFWRRPPYGELDGFDIVREIEVEEPSTGWGAGTVRLRVEYAGVIADSLHSPERAYGRSFETTSGRIVSRGAYLTGGTFWVPWTGDDLFAFDLTVTTPPDWRVVSQGNLESEEERPASRRTRWVSPEPMEEIYLIAGPYELSERRHGAVRVMAYTYANTGPEIVEPYLEATGPVLDRYGELFGPYPFGKFALVENYWQTGYGMPSFTFLGDRVIRLPFIVSTSYPHEILHNWWGNGVYLRRGEGNWCEGLTTYCADYAAKEKEGGAAAGDYRRGTLQGYRDFAAAGGKDFALLGFRERDSAATQAVGYGKTLMVFHMLRHAVGDDRFHSALREFYERHRFRRAGWDELRVAFENETEAGAGSLVPFFEQWVERPGAPVVRLRDVSVEPAGDGRFRVDGIVEQDEPAFDLNLPVVMEGESDTLRVTVPVGGAESGFSVAVSFAPEWVKADPDFDVFRLLHEAEVPAALSGVLGASRVRVVIGSDTGGEMREALLAVANDWARDSTVTVIEESDGESLAAFDGGTWLFGTGRRVREMRRDGWPGSAAEGPGTIVAAGRMPEEGAAARPLGLLLPESAEIVPAIARKVPHYSKYSWLRFEGTSNVGKGLWEPGPSPLSVSLR